MPLTPATPAPCVVLPTYQEAANVCRIVYAIRAAVPEASVLVVDDGSPDGTADLAASAGAAVLRRAGARGLGPAYREGFCRALREGFDPIFQMDADFSHDPADLPRLRAALRDADSAGGAGADLAGADLVIGSRYVAGGATLNWALHRRMLSRFGSRYARTILGVPIHDLTGGFKCWRAAALARIDPASLACDGYGFQIEATWRALRAGARVVEVPICFTERREGASKMRTSIAVEAALTVPRLRLAGWSPQ